MRQRGTNLLTRRAIAMPPLFLFSFHSFTSTLFQTPPFPLPHVGHHLRSSKTRCPPFPVLHLKPRRREPLSRVREACREHGQHHCNPPPFSFTCRIAHLTSPHPVGYPLPLKSELALLCVGGEGALGSLPPAVCSTSLIAALSVLSRHRPAQLGFKHLPRIQRARRRPS